jgi:TolB-like protein
MRKITTLFSIIFFSISTLYAQTIKVAILDFENTSGIAKYNGLGKAMSSMLITDIEANVSPKRLQLVERSQIQKILKEQNFQASSAVDKTTTVKAGKLLGVKYLLVGDIYILNDVLVINARLTDTETGDIKFSKKQEGKLVGWLTLKTNIAKDLASNISMPFTEPNIPDNEINVAVITNFGNAIAAKDTGNIKKAEELINTVQDFSPNFKYIEDVKAELEELKIQVRNNTQDITLLKQSGGRIVNPIAYEDYLINLRNPLTTYDECFDIVNDLVMKFSDRAAKDFESLYAFPQIWTAEKWDVFISNEAMILKDIDKMIYSIESSKNKKAAATIWKHRLSVIEMFMKLGGRNSGVFYSSKDVLNKLSKLEKIINSSN